MTAALEVCDLSVRLGGVDVVRDVSLQVEPGTVVGLVGPNGAGKTTLVDAVTGFVPCRGEVRLAGRAAGHLRPHQRTALGVARTFQSLELFEDLTVAENLAVAAEAGPGGGGPPAARVARAAAATGLDGELDLLPGRLPHRRRKALALARALAAEPSVVLLDEPAAGLDGPDRAALAATVRRLAGEGTAVVVVDHDVGLVLETCDEVALLEQGRLVACGRPATVHDDLLAAFGQVPGGPSSPRPPSRRSAPASAGPPVLELRGLSAGYGGAAVIHDVDLSVGGGEVVALLGANGAGKTTTLRAASGLLSPITGSVHALGGAVGGRPERVARRGVAHAPQDRGPLPTLTVAEQLRLAAGPGPAGRRRVGATVDRLPALRPLLGRRAAVLSGGEQQLVSLGRCLVAGPRLLLVDELSLGLAPALAGHALALLRALADEEGTGVLLVEQFAPLALAVADRACVLRRGQVAAAAGAAELAARPDLLEAAYLGPVGGREGEEPGSVFPPRA
jgi:branched-chain amino acid transport system ATP-binding protein